jgi:hypothetical protein
MQISHTIIRFYDNWQLVMETIAPNVSCPPIPRENEMIEIQDRSYFVQSVRYVYGGEINRIVIDLR